MLSSVVTRGPPSLPKGARFECADSSEHARLFDVLLVEDFPDEARYHTAEVAVVQWKRATGGRLEGASSARCAGDGIIMFLCVCTYQHDASGVRRI